MRRTAGNAVAADCVPTQPVEPVWVCLGLAAVLIGGGFV